MNKEKIFNTVTQIALPLLTIAGQMAFAAKLPLFGLILNLLAQPFWIYSCWKSYKQAGQIGILITTIVYTFITIAGIINYWWF